MNAAEAAMAGIFARKGSGGSEGTIYSVGEVDTGGTWVDNEPVYRLIIDDINTRSFSANLSDYIAGSIDTFIYAEACFYNSSTGEMFMLSSQSTNNTYVTYTENTNTIAFTTNQSGFVILWAMIDYTKEVS